MNATHEIIEYNEDMPMKLFYQRIGNIAKHWHRSLELLFVLSGEMNVMIGSQSFVLKEDDIIVINPNVLHETCSKDCVLLSLQMRMSMFHMSWLTPEGISFHCNSSEVIDKAPYYKIKQLLARMLQSNFSGNLQNNLTNLSYAFQLMNELVQNFKAENNEEAVLSQKALVRLRSITDYIEAHFTQNLTLTDVATHEYMSPSYLSHFFEKHMGITFSAYLTKLRLEHSLRDLYQDASIEEISDRNGFPSPRSYATLFRKQYGMLPSIYRKDILSEHKMTSPLVENHSSNYLILEKNNYFDKLVPYLSDAASLNPNKDKVGAKRKLQEIHVKESSSLLKHSFRNFCSVGRARELLYEDIRQMLRIQQTEMPFQYIKFHGIFDDAMSVYREDRLGNPILDFYYTDLVLDFLLDIKLIPMIQLSFMPKDMAKEPSKTLFYYPFIISEPKEDRKWEYLVHEFTNHVVKRYGGKEVSSWIFTFWNETLNDFPFDFSEVEASLRLYQLSYKTVKALLPSVCFASTSYILSDFPSENYKRYLEYAEEHGCLPDAYLFNFYSVDCKKPLQLRGVFSGDFVTENSGLTLSSDPDQFHKYIQDVKAYLGLEQQAPVYITEWNFTSSHREWLNDTCYSSCYIVRNILQNYDRMESFCHWSLTDRLEELPPAAETFHGGMGFFTRGGIKKPAYYAYYLLTKLEDLFITQGEGYFLTKNADASRYSLILYNYHHYSELYGEGINFNTTFTERYHAFPTACALDFDLILNGLKDGAYAITHTYVNRSHGSVFDQWLRMGEPSELETLRSLSVPMMTKNHRVVTDGSLSLNVELEPHEIRLIQLVLE
jgi:xylan 1,4-beta-xylosidase